MPFPVVLLTVLLLKIYYQKEPFTYQYVVLLAFFSAFGLSIKLSFLPLLIIPFMVIEGWKKRLIFTASAIVLFSIIAFPMTLQFHIFWDWVKNLVLHSGTYGQGDTNIIDFASLQKNLRELIGYEKKYFYLFLTLIGTLAAYLILYKKKVEKRIVIFAIAVIATIALQLLLVGKHYAHRYFIPVLLLSPFMVFIISELIKKLIPHKFTHVFINIGMICFLLWSIQLNQAWLPLKTEAMQTDIENRMPTWHFAQSLDKNSYKIITSQNYGCPFIEYTLMYSTAWANNKKKAEYAPILGKLYPNTYNYFTWDNTLKHWGDKFSVPQIIASGEKVYLYLERNDEELFDKTIDKLVEENGMSFSIKRELSYLNDKTNEVIYQLIFNPPATEPQNLN